MSTKTKAGRARKAKKEEYSDDDSEREEELRLYAEDHATQNMGLPPGLGDLYLASSGALPKKKRAKRAKKATEEDVAAAREAAVAIAEANAAAGGPITGKATMELVDAATGGGLTKKQQQEVAREAREAAQKARRPTDSRVEKGLKDPMLLISRLPTEVDGHRAEIFRVRGTSGSEYDVTVGKRMSCTCPDVRFRQQLCKHQAAVLFRVLGLSWDNPLVGPGIYTEAQVDDILDGKMTDQANLDYAMIPPPPIKRLLIDLGESKSRKGNKTCILTWECPDCSLTCCTDCKDDYEELKPPEGTPPPIGPPASCPLCRDFALTEEDVAQAQGVDDLYGPAMGQRIRARRDLL